jgi:4-amino-4-deoxy-L-arabinose transferase-like glycosyltransferase
VTAAGERRLWLCATALIVALTMLRLVMVFASDLNLGPDEAQYWSWSLEPAFGYFSKPPMIAWIIAGFTSVCGDGEGCVRAASPLLYGLAALCVFETGRLLYGARIAFWACLVFATLPGISLSSGLITTDVPLLAFWSGALLVLAALLQRPPGEARGLALALGALIGLAMLSKYAGGYFLLGLALAALLDHRVRAHVLGLNGALILGATLLLVSPNIVWNLHHGFATLSHTASNAGLDNPKLFNPDRLAEFFGAQFGLLGPILMAVIVAGLALRLRGDRWPRATGDDTVLLAISLPVLLVGLVIAFVSKANANWAAPALVGFSLVATAWLVRSDRMKWLYASLAIALVVGAALFAAAVSPRFVEMVGQTNAFKLLRGWNTQGPAIARAAHEGGFTTLLAEDREDMASLLYYTRGQGLTIRMWTPDPAHPTDHFQMARAFDGAPERLLFVTRRDDARDVTQHFGVVHELEVTSLVIGMKRGEPQRRTFHFIELGAFKGAVNAR